MGLPTQLSSRLRAAAIEHQPEGCDHVAWERPDALAVIDELAGSGVAILGGDVLCRVGETFEHSFDNWSVERHTGERWVEYAERSRSAARAYVSRYAEPAAGEVAYAFTFSLKPSADQLAR